jgi:hypothetical protein
MSLYIKQLLTVAKDLSLKHLLIYLQGIRIFSRNMNQQ